MRYNPDTGEYYVEIPRGTHGKMISIKDDQECTCCEKGLKCPRADFNGSVWSTLMKIPLEEEADK